MGSPEQAKPFGQQLYDLLCDRGKQSVITGRLNYAAIQQLKSASRQEVLKIFRSNNKELLGMLECDSPELIASYLAGLGLTRFGGHEVKPFDHERSKWSRNRRGEAPFLPVVLSSLPPIKD